VAEESVSRCFRPLAGGTSPRVPASDAPVFVDGKPDTALDDLAALGVRPNDGGQWADERQVLRGRSRDMGPDIAWFTDPAGNVFSVQQP
jgi:hypothetical protein